MCGIVGYIGPQSVVPVIIEGLRRLEYRGYDSAGIAVAGGPEGLALRRAPGKLRNLETVIADAPLNGPFGIGHTRWATPARPNQAHPQPYSALPVSSPTAAPPPPQPQTTPASRRAPPPVIGIGEGEFFLASAVPGILHHPRNIHFLADGELAVLTPEGVHLTDFDAKPIPLRIQRITWDPIQAEKAGYKHFMLKEINEQPRAIRDTTLGRVSLTT